MTVKTIRMNAVLYAGLLVLMLSGCTTLDTSKGQPVALPGLENYQPLPLDVAQTQVISRNVPDPKALLATDFPLTLEDAIKAYANRRFSAQAPAGRLDVIINKAQITQRIEEPENKFLRWTTLDTRLIYTAAVELTLVTYDQNGVERVASNLAVGRSTEILDRQSLAEKDKAKLKFLESIIADIDRSVLGALVTAQHILSATYLPAGMQPQPVSQATQISKPSAVAPVIAPPVTQSQPIQPPY